MIEESETEDGGLPNRADSNGQHDRISDRVAQELRHRIITLELRPGTPIIEAQLMKQLGCGRTPLREALQRLADEYLIRVVPRRGMSIAEVGVLELQQVYDARHGIEGLIAGLVAERCSDQRLEVLDALTREMRQAGEIAALYDVVRRDIRFHLLLADYCDNRYIRDAFVRFSGLAMRLMYFAHSRGQAIAETPIEHDRIIASLRTHDPSLAVRAMQEHIRQAKERILRTLIG